MVSLDRKLCTAPLMQHTDRHFRFLLRLISRHVLLYTEMVTTGALLHGKRDRLLEFHADEHPLALQLGGSDPRALAECARIAEEWGYDEINLNVGCPSDRVQSGRFGACLMAEPDLVADCIAAMRAATQLPVTVKTRIGINDCDAYENLCRFIEPVHAAGCGVFIIHARKAWLQGLSPKENRSKPPLNYGRVYRLKRDFPQLTVVINGGIETLPAAQSHLQHVDGAMIGRAVCQNPFLLAKADCLLYGSSTDTADRFDVMKRYCDYARTQLDRGVCLHKMTRHLLGLFQGQPGARAFRRMLCEQGRHADAGIEVLTNAARQITLNKASAHKQNPLAERVKRSVYSAASH